MGNKRLFYPGTMMQEQSLIQRRQDSFLGMNTNDPASELGQGEYPLLENAIAFGKSFQGRSGSRSMYSVISQAWDLLDLEYDADGKTYKANKAGSKVYIHEDEGCLLIADLKVGDYLVSIDRSHCEQITEIVASPEAGLPYFVSRNESTIAIGEWLVRKMVWGGFYSEHQEGMIYHQGTKLYYTSYGRHFEIIFNGDSDETIAESESVFRPEENDIIVFNANGIYRIVFSGTGQSRVAIYFKMNAANPSARITEVAKLSNQNKLRNYLYTMVKITGESSGSGDRTKYGSKIIQESSPVSPDRVTRLDATKVYGEKRVGPSTTTMGKLTSGTPVHTNITDWRAISDGSFAIQINGLGVQDIICNFTNCDTLEDVSIVIKNALQPYFPGAQCYLETVSGTIRLVITSGEVDGGTVSNATNAASGTNLLTGGLGYLKLKSTDIASGCTLDNTYLPDQQYLVQGMTAPANSKHWSHFGIWGSKDPNAVAGNLEDLIVWVKDVPLIKTFIADFNFSTQLATVTSGEKLFKLEDVGSVVHWGDEEYAKAKILFLCDSGTNPVPGDTESKYAFLELPIVTDADKSAVNLSIGAARMANASRSGNQVTVIPIGTSKFSIPSAIDKGELLYWEDGEISHIINSSYDTNSGQWIFTTFESGTKSSQAVAWKYSRILIGRGIQHWAYTGPHWISDITGDMPEDSDIGLPIALTINGVDQGFFEGQTLKEILSSDSFSYGEGGGGYFADREVTFIIQLLPSRSYNDNVSDDILSSRFQRDAAMVLQTRTFEPLPSTKIGEVAQNFIVVSPEGTNKIKYSEMPTGRKYTTGYYHAGYQADDVIDDIVLNIKKYQDRIVAQCKKSHWATTVSAFSSIDEAAIGEKIFTLPVFSIIDRIGWMPGGTRDLGIGKSIVVSPDGTMRLFNGSQFGQDDLSKAVWPTEFAVWAPKVITSYDPTGGLIVFGSKKVNSQSFNTINNIDGECFRLAMQDSQGSGWSKFSGLDMVWPHPNTEGYLATDTFGNQICVMLDELTGEWHQISTFDGPAGSGLVRSTTDKNSAEIVSTLRTPDYTGASESFLLEHLESHIYLRPFYKNGSYPTGFEISCKCFQGDDELFNAITKDIPVEGDTVFERRTRARRISLQYSFSMANYIAVCTDSWFNSIDTSGSTAQRNRESTEEIQQEALSNALVWLSRGLNPTMNRANAIPATGTIARIQGPDGEQYSAMLFNGDAGLTVPAIAPITGDFTIQFGLKIVP